MGKVGFRHSEESKQKMREAKLGITKPEGWGERHSEIMKEHWKLHPRTYTSKYDEILTNDLLYDLYVTDRMSIRAIAKFCGCGHTTVRHALIKHKIERRPHSCPIDINKRKSAKYQFHHKLAFEVYGWERRCSICDSEEQIVIHHLNKDRYDNSKENLIVLCQSCHSRMHRVMESFEKKMSSDQEVITNAEV